MSGARRPSRAGTAVQLLGQATKTAAYAAAATASAYYVWKWLAGTQEPATQAHASLDARDHLTESCEIWEAALKKAMLAGDTATANRLRLVLRRAYSTIESFDSSFNENNIIIRQERTELESAFEIDSDAGSFNTAASMLYEQDLTGFELPVSSPRARLPSRNDLWTEALSLARAGKITIRKYRPAYTGCNDEIHFAARVHCCRKGFDAMMKQPANRNILRDAFLHAVSGVVIRGGEDPAPLHKAWEVMEAWLLEEHATDGMTKIEKEMQGRGVPYLTFFDLAFDFLLFDAWDVTENPPSSVKAALATTWMPTSIKMRTLKSTLWGIIRTRSSLFKSGTFMKHFYMVMAVAVPALGCGMLGLGDDGFVKLVDQFQKAQLEFIQRVFAIPDTIGDLTPESYADQIIVITKQLSSRVNAQVALALEGMAPKAN